MQQKEVAIIGGGIGGIIAALFLARIKDNSGAKAYNIHIFEQKDKFLTGASEWLARLHFGGEYPLHAGTSMDCVKGAFLFTQAFPTEVFSSIKGIDYVVTKSSAAKGSLTVSRLINQYEKNIALYGRLLEKAPDRRVESLLGAPGEIFQPLQEHELQPNFAGGIRTKEYGFNSEVLNPYLLRQLEIERIGLHLLHKVHGTFKRHHRYILCFQGQPDFEADIVVNASWESGYSLDRAWKTPLPRKAYLRALALADISRCADMGRPVFALINNDGGMYSPYSHNRAILYAPVVSHLRETNLDVARSAVPDSWGKIDGQENVLAEKMLNHFTGLFPHLSGMKVVDVRIKPTISFDGAVYQRQHAGAAVVAPNWYAVTPTKATFAVRSAMEMIKLVHEEAAEGFDMDSNPIVPAAFRFN